MSLELPREEQGSLNWSPVTSIQMVARRELGTGLFNPLVSAQKANLVLLRKSK